MNKPIRAVCYCRVSTIQQTDGVSLDMQRDRLAAHCKAKGWEVAEVVVDAGESAKNLRRPGAQKVLTQARRKSFDILLVYKLDRMFRSATDCLLTVRELERYGVRFESLQEEISTNSAHGILFLTMLSAMAEWERNIIGDRTKDALASKRAKGFRVGAVPFGFQESDRGKLVPLEGEQRVLETIQQCREQGWGFRKIASKLNAESVPAKQGGQWSPKVVRGVLQARKRSA